MAEPGFAKEEFVSDGTSVDEGVAQMVRPAGYLYPDSEREALYAEQYAIFAETVELMIDSGLYEKVARFQNRHWG